MTKTCEQRTLRIREASIRYRGATSRGATLRTSRDVAAWLRTIDPMADAVESLVVIALDAKHRPVSWHLASRGGATSSVVDVAAILRFAVLAGAPTFVLAHNHPSGDPTPSADDRAVTQRMITAFKAVGLRLLDHVILGDGVHFSFADAGEMEGAC